MASKNRRILYLHCALFFSLQPLYICAMETMKYRILKPLFFIIIVVLFSACSDEDDPVVDTPAGSGIPELVTFPANMINQFKADGGGAVISEGNSDITLRGLVWSDATGVTLDSAIASTSDGNQIGTFLTTIDRKSETEMFLDSNTTYYMRAYAVNDQGVGYGEELSFTTMENFYMEGEPVADVNGNTYRTVVYEKGGKTWMAENLKTTSYSNGDAIPFISDTEEWKNDSIGAYCYWENDPSFIEDYGILYNYYVVKDPRGVCPIGYHVPDNIEWATLREHIAEFSSSTSNINSQLKEEGLEFWSSGSYQGNNFSGFSARGAGARVSGIFGDFVQIDQETRFWSSSEFQNPIGESVLSAFSIGFGDNPLLLEDDNIQRFGYSIRCVKDE
jgi:uncharacterized protein (TIGR02145 family)